MSLVLHIAVVSATLAVSGVLGSPLVRLAFWLAKVPNPRDLEAGNSEGEVEVLRGGRMIGILERIAITALLLAGYPAGIGAIVAIKGLGRFHELRGPHGAQASEKFVIGTLASYLWAGLAASVGIMIRALI